MSSRFTGKAASKHKVGSNLHSEEIGKESTRENVVYVGFIDFEKAYDRMNRLTGKRHGM